MLLFTSCGLLSRESALLDLRGSGRSYIENEKDIRMSPRDSHEIAGYRFEFQGTKPVLGPNYRADRGHFVVYRNNRQIAELFPEKWLYLGGGMPMTEAAIDAGLLRDIYVSLGEGLGNGDWSLRLYYKPYVRWIWLGAILMALGGLLAVLDPRYRRRATTA